MHWLMHTIGQQLEMSHEMFNEKNVVKFSKFLVPDL